MNKRSLFETMAHYIKMGFAIQLELADESQVRIILFKWEPLLGKDGMKFGNHKTLPLETQADGLPLIMLLDSMAKETIDKIANYPVEEQ